MSRPGDGEQGKRAPSAGDAEWREIKVRIVPRSEGASTAVWIRAHRGGSLVWDRRLSVWDLPAGTEAATKSASGVLRAAAAALIATADRLDNL